MTSANYLRLYVSHYRGTSQCLRLLDRCFQSLKRKKLYAGVDGQHHIMSRHGFLLPDIVNDPAASIADHSARPGHPGQILVSGQFNTFLTMIAAAGKSHNVSDSRAIGIFTQHFWRNTDAGSFKSLTASAVRTS